MPINLEQFAVECIPEIESRLGAKLERREGLELKNELLDPARYFSACQALKRLLPEGASSAPFDVQDPGEISPSHFVSLIETYLSADREIHKEHIAGCPNCTEVIHSLASAMLSILDGADPDDALGYLKQDDASAPITIVRISRGDTGDERWSRWANLMLDPEYVALAAKALEGLTKEQGKEALINAFRLVTDLPQTPEPWSFQLLMNSSRLLVLERPDKP